MSVGVVLRASALVFVASLLQASLASSVSVAGGAPDLLLLVVVCLGLVRGSIPGALAGFAGGLIVDVLTLETLGLTSLVLTLAGFWAGRHAETSRRDGSLDALLSVLVIAVLAVGAGVALRSALGHEVDLGHAFVTTLVPSLALDLILVLPVLGVVKALVGSAPEPERSREVELVV